MKLFSNHILIRLTKKTDELQLPGIGTLQIETVFDEERHQRLVGIVVQNPDELIFKNMDHSGMPWQTEIETMVGDEVIMRRTDVSVARHEGRSFEIDGHLHVYIEYHSLILAKRPFSIEDFSTHLWWPFKNVVETENGLHHVIMLNGFMLVEQDDTDMGTTLTLPEEFKGKKALTGVIKYMGKPNKAYHDNYNSVGQKITGELPDSRFNLSVGDRIGFLPFAALDLEFELHRTFEGSGKHFGRLQRNKVLCKLD